MCSRKIDADLILVNEHETISNHYLGRWMSGLVSGLQNQPRLFESGTALNNLWGGGRGGQCGGLKIRRWWFDSTPPHMHVLVRKGVRTTLMSNKNLRTFQNFEIKTRRPR